MLGVKLFTVELGVLVPYPEEGKDARDHRRPSALQRKPKRHLEAHCDAFMLSQTLDHINLALLNYLSLIFHSLKKIVELKYLRLFSSAVK